jgi:hypothetical protein
MRNSFTYDRNDKWQNLYLLNLLVLTIIEVYFVEYHVHYLTKRRGTLYR